MELLVNFILNKAKRGQKSRMVGQMQCFSRTELQYNRYLTITYVIIERHKQRSFKNVTDGGTDG